MGPNQQLASVCGLFCASCTVYIGSHEDPERLRTIAAGFGCSVDELTCQGCRSDKRALHCRECEFISCADKRHVDFCGQCVDYPCVALREFQAKMPHRLELWEAHRRIREVGAAAWCEEMAARYSCESCKTLNSAYDLSCRSCGHGPGNDFVRAHGEAIAEHLKRKKLR
jgi:hypothetical protein